MLLLSKLKKILGWKHLPNWLNFPCYSREDQLSLQYYNKHNHWTNWKTDITVEKLQPHLLLNNFPRTFHYFTASRGNLCATKAALCMFKNPAVASNKSRRATSNFNEDQRMPPSPWPNHGQSSSKVAASISKKNACTVFCFIVETQFLYQLVINSKPGSTPNPILRSFRHNFFAVCTIAARQPQLHQKCQQRICRPFCAIGSNRSCTSTSNVWENTRLLFCHLSRDKVAHGKVQGNLQLFSPNKSRPVYGDIY